jgi:2-polyprenyl-3-methyl-5-hydroxy-6-metoxy-1,4-benzoquinol methylase
LEGEKLALSYADRLPVAVARIPEVYGPGDRRLLKLFRMIIKNKFFIIGSGKNLHHLIYVEDLIEGLFLLSEAEEAVGQIFLFAGEKAISTREMADTVGNVLERKVPRIHAPLWPFLSAATVMEKILRPMGIQPPLHRRRMDFFRKNFSLSANKSKKLLAFTPKYSFEAGAFETARWYRENNLLEKSQSSEDHTLPENMVMDQDLTAQIEPFDTFWEAPTDVEKGFSKFAKFYKRNYLSFFPRDRSIRILVISCGAGYMVDLLKKEGYTDVHGIDSDPEKIEIARSHGLGCTTANAFPFLRQEKKPYGLIFAEQELNHLTKTEILTFLNLCHQNLTKKGRLIVHSLNGANPITGSEALSQNFDHYNTMTEYSIKQILCHAGFSSVQVFPLKLYIFFENPMNYIGLIADKIINIIFRVVFIFYGKSNKLFSKKIAAIAFK